MPGQPGRLPVGKAVLHPQVCRLCFLALPVPWHLLLGTPSAPSSLGGGSLHPKPPAGLAQSPGREGQAEGLQLACRFLSIFHSVIRSWG